MDVVEIQNGSYTCVSILENGRPFIASFRFENPANNRLGFLHVLHLREFVRVQADAANELCVELWFQRSDRNKFTIRGFIRLEGGPEY